MLRNMRTVFCAIPVILVAALSGCGGGGGGTGMPMLNQGMMPPDRMMPDEGGESTIHLSSYLTEAVEQGTSPGLLAAIVDQNGVRAVGAAGVRRQGSPQQLMVNDLVHLGSNTKAMTSTMLATLVADGTFPNGWDTTIADVFPELVGEIHQDYRSVDLFQLVRMKSGMAMQAKDWSAHLGNPDIIERRYAILRDNLIDPPTGPVGDFLYSNVSYMVAGAMAERLTGKSWETLMEERLFTPLGITTAGFGAPNTPDQVDQPWGHRRDERGAWAARQFDNALALGPAGTVHISIEDWAKFIALWFRSEEPAILDRSSLNELITPDSGFYAAGWNVGRRDWADGTVIFHIGSNTYWYATLWIAPNRGIAYIAVANSAESDSSETHDVLDAIISNLISDPPSSTVAADDDDMSAPDPTLQWERILTADKDATLAAATQAAMALPTFGGAIQSTNRDAAGVTTDVVETMFDGETLIVRIDRHGADPISLNTADHVSEVVSENAAPGHTFRSWSLASTSDAGADVADVDVYWNNEDPTDYLAGGYWMHVDGNLATRDISNAEMGAFVDGPELASGNPPVMPVQGTARYSGTAEGLYAHAWSSASGRTPGSVSTGPWSAIADLTADFGANTIQGCIGCGSAMLMGGTFVDGETGIGQQLEEVSLPFALHLGATDIGTNGGFRDSTVTVSYDNLPTTSSGAWGGKFSNISDDEGNPRLVAGTVGAHSAGSAGETSFIGAFVATAE